MSPKAKDKASKAKKQPEKEVQLTDDEDNEIEDDVDEESNFPNLINSLSLSRLNYFQSVSICTLVLHSLDIVTVRHKNSSHSPTFHLL